MSICIDHIFECSSKIILKKCIPTYALKMNTMYNYAKFAEDIKICNYMQN